MSKTRVGVFIALLIVAGSFFLRSKPKKQEPQREASVDYNETQIRKIDSEVEKELKEEKKIIEKRMALEMKERDLSLKRLPLRRENQEIVLQLEIAARPSCHPGDADAIQMDLRANPSHKLLATLEPLSKGQKALHWDLSDEFVRRGALEKEFRLPVPERPSLWGLYLCTARSGDTTCRDKAVVDINDIFTEHLTKKPKAGQQLRSIYYQVFLLDDWGVAAFADLPRKSERFKQFEKYAVERGISSRESERGFDLTQKNTQTLLSLPFNFEENVLRIELPKYNLEACARMKSRATE